MAWTRSDTIAAAAFGVSLVGVLIQYLDRRQPFDVQAYVDQTQAASKIIDSVEQVISARQLAMVGVEYNIYEPERLTRMSVEQMNSDAKEATPVLTALGNYKGALQNNVRFFHAKTTLSALSKLDEQVDRSIKCFTDLASARHKFGPKQLGEFQQIIAGSCAGANIPNSLDNLKNAEADAINAMDAEKAASSGKS